MSRVKKIGFLGGSFDPIHFGHLQLAIDLFEKHALDEILFCPAFCSPFKTNSPPVAKAEERLLMLQEVLGKALNFPPFTISTLEIERKGISFTIETLRSLQKEGSLHLLLSSESAKGLSSWANYQEILEIAPPLIGKRAFPISSTEIRERLKKNLCCEHLVPRKALDYILAHGLYS